MFLPSSDTILVITKENITYKSIFYFTHWKLKKRKGDDLHWVTMQSLRVEVMFLSM